MVLFSASSQPLFVCLPLSQLLFGAGLWNQRGFVRGGGTSSSSSKPWPPGSVAAFLGEYCRTTRCVRQAPCKGGYRAGRSLVYSGDIERVALITPALQKSDLRHCRLTRQHLFLGVPGGVPRLRASTFFFFALFMPTPGPMRGMVDAVSMLPVFLRTRGEVGPPLPLSWPILRRALEMRAPPAVS